MLQFQVLLAPVVALMGLAFLFNAILRRFHETKHEQLAFGILFGATIVVGMTNPLSIGDGLIFDTRTLLLGSAVVFVGPIAGAVALIAGVTCRLFIGGAGTLAGVVGLFFAFGIAIAWYYLMRTRITNKILSDILLGFAMTVSIFALFVLPRDLATDLLISILPTLLICNVIGTVAIGLVFRREMRYFNDNKELATDAQTDALTNLLNRRGMDSKVSGAKFDTARGHALFYFDIDNFKHINDTFGHASGDATLAIIAARINEAIRGEAVFARHGGDEFSIYMPSLDAADVQAVGDRLCAVVSGQKFTHDNNTFAVSISIGAYWTKQDLPLQDMIDRADTQLLLAKRAGKGRAQIAYDNDNSASEVA